MKQEIRDIDKSQMREDIAAFNIGDNLRMFTRIIEGNNERIQRFSGTLIARKGTGASETITLRRVLYGEGVERVFLLHSPKIEKIEVEREGQVRRAKLYYLRDRIGKKARVKEKKRVRVS